MFLAVLLPYHQVFLFNRIPKFLGLSCPIISHSSTVSGKENSMDRGAWRATVQGSQRVGHDWVCTHSVWFLTQKGTCLLKMHIFSIYFQTLTTSDTIAMKFKDVSIKQNSMLKKSHQNVIIWMAGSSIFFWKKNKETNSYFWKCK